MLRLILVALLYLVSIVPVSAEDEAADLEWAGTSVVCIGKKGFDKKVKTGEIKIIGIARNLVPENKEAEAKMASGNHYNTRIMMSFVIIDPWHNVTIVDSNFDYDKVTRKVVNEYLCMREQVHNFKFYHGEKLDNTFVQNEIGE